MRICWLLSLEILFIFCSLLSRFSFSLFYFSTCYETSTWLRLLASRQTARECVCVKYYFQRDIVTRYYSARLAFMAKNLDLLRERELTYALKTSPARVSNTEKKCERKLRSVSMTFFDRHIKTRRKNNGFLGFPSKYDGYFLTFCKITTQHSARPSQITFRNKKHTRISNLTKNLETQSSNISEKAWTIA